MEWMIVAGVIVTLLGLAGLVYCITKAAKAKRSGLEGEELTAHLRSLVTINLGALFLSAIGLMLVVVGILL